MARDLLEGYDLGPEDMLSQSLQNTNMGKRPPRDLLEDYEGYGAPQQQMHPLAQKLEEYINSRPGLQNFVQKGGEYGETAHNVANTIGIPGAIGGFVQGAINTPISVANLVADKAAGHRIPHFNINDYANIEPTMGNMIGQFAGEIAAPGGAIGKGAKVAGALRPSGWSGMLVDALKGMGLGYALGEDAEGDRGIGTLAGGLGNAIKGITKSAILNRILKGEEKAQNLSSKAYNEIFEGAEHYGAKAVKAPKLEIGHLSRNATKEQIAALKAFQKNPTVKNAHLAQSDLGHLIRELKHKKSVGGLLSGEKKALAEAIATQKKLKGTIHTALPKDVANKYHKTTSEYGKKVIPYREAEGLRGYKAKEFGKGTAFKKLNEDEQFRIALEQYNPDFMANKGLDYILKGAGTAGGAYYGTSPILKALGIGIHHEK